MGRDKVPQAGLLLWAHQVLWWDKQVIPRSGRAFVVGPSWRVLVQGE